MGKLTISPNERKQIKGFQTLKLMLRQWDWRMNRQYQHLTKRRGMQTWGQHHSSGCVQYLSWFCCWSESPGASPAVCLLASSPAAAAASNPSATHTHTQVYFLIIIFHAPLLSNYSAKYFFLSHCYSDSRLAVSVHQSASVTHTVHPSLCLWQHQSDKQ